MRTHPFFPSRRGIAASDVVPLPASALATTFPPTILLVDDDTSVRNSLCRVLASESFQVETARGTKDALDRIFRHTPDLVVTDLCMLPLSGWDLIQQLQTRRPALPVFVITALPKQSAGIANRADIEFFQKPIDLDVLIAAVRRQLGPPRSPRF